MAEQSFLAKAGLRLGILGSSASLAFAAPLATGNYDPSCHTDAARIGMYYDRTAGAEAIGFIVGGQSGPLFTRSGTSVNVLFPGASPTLTIGSGTGTPAMVLNGATATNRFVAFQTAGVLRWQLGTNNTAEGGANAGSDFVLNAYTDLGVLIDTPMTITRAAGGLISFGRSIAINTGALGASCTISSVAGTDRAYKLQTAGSDRWNVACNNVAESGSNAGSDFEIRAYSDTGVLIDKPLTIIRAAQGAVTINRPIQIIAGTFTGSQNMFLGSATWNNAASTFTGLKINITDTLSNSGSTLLNLQISTVARFILRKDGLATFSSVDDLTGPQALFARSFTLTGNLTDVTQITLTAVINGAFTITRYNYFNVTNITGAATVTNGCVFRFNAAAGTHKAVDAATTKTTPGGVDAWMKQNINGTLYFQPLYLSKTA